MKAKTIEISNWELLNSFLPALHSLGNLELNDMSVMLNIVKMKRACRTAMEDYDTLYQEIAKANALTENGSPIVEDGNYVYENDEIKAETFKKIIDLQQQKIELDMFEIPQSALENVKGLNPNLLDSLYSIIN